MNRSICFLALATAWCADAVLMFTLAEARWGSVMYRLCAIVLLVSAVIALVVAFGPQAWRALRRLSVVALDRWSARRGTHSTGHEAPSGLPTPAH